ncbi:MAG: hypothetical protein HC827_06750 [Cyanobacteria bacterium RM1_2_2]|nr:hypothetical protein [Cyanobacteria bacterium RM1_2_2]
MPSLSELLLTPVAKTPRSRLVFWFSLSLAFALVYGVLAWQEAFSSAYLVQDDARQHVFWMRRFTDPDLFPNDLIADYFQSVAPWGYTLFYRLFALLGIDPLLLSKLLPMALGLGAAAYGFGVGLQLLPVPLTGFLSSLLVSQVVWGHEDIASASPRAFMPLIFLAFLYYLHRRSLLPCLATIALEGLFYPQYVFVFAGILLLQPLRWQRGLRLSSNQQDYWFCIAGLVVAFLVMLPFALTSSAFGPTITAAEARPLPEFYPGGRSVFFNEDPLFFWLIGIRSGIFPYFLPPIMGLGILLPLLLKLPHRFPLVSQVTHRTSTLLHLPIVGLGLFFLAHAVLFKLHLPSRYTAYTLRFALVLATAVVLTLLLDAGLRWLSRQSQPSRGARVLVGGVSSLLALAILLFPSYAPEFPDTNYKVGEEPELYAFLAQQPKEIVVASLVRKADFIPTFAQRSILVGREYAIPYHVGYANQFRQRATDLLKAQYTTNRAELRQFIQTYGVDYWLIDQDSFSRKFLQEEWVKQYPSAVEAAKTSLQQQKTPALKRLANRCTVSAAGDLSLLDAKCLLAPSQPG